MVRNAAELVLENLVTWSLAFRLPHVNKNAQVLVADSSPRRRLLRAQRDTLVTACCRLNAHYPAIERVLVRQTWGNLRTANQSTETVSLFSPPVTTSVQDKPRRPSQALLKALCIDSMLTWLTLAHTASGLEQRPTIAMICSKATMPYVKRQFDMYAVVQCDVTASISAVC